MTEEVRVKEYAKRTKNISGIFYFCLPVPCYFSKSGTHNISVGVQRVEYRLINGLPTTVLVIRHLKFDCPEGVAKSVEVIQGLQRVSTKYKTCRDNWDDKLFRHINNVVESSLGWPTSYTCTFNDIMPVRRAAREISGGGEYIGCKYPEVCNRLNTLLLDVLTKYGLRWKSAEVKFRVVPDNAPGVLNLVLNDVVVGKRRRGKWTVLHWISGVLEPTRNFGGMFCLACGCSVSRDSHYLTEKHRANRAHFFESILNAISNRWFDRNNLTGLPMVGSAKNIAELRTAVATCLREMSMSKQKPKEKTATSL